MRVTLDENEVVVGRHSTGGWFLLTRRGQRHYLKFSCLVKALRLFLRVDDKEEQ